MSALHIYEGDCPDELDPDARDPSCPACKELLAFEAIARRKWDELENGMNGAQFYEAIQEQHPELAAVIDSNKSSAFDAVLQKCRELGMEENYNVPVINNVLEFIESLAGVKRIVELKGELSFSARTIDHAMMKAGAFINKSKDWIDVYSLDARKLNDGWEIKVTYTQKEDEKE